MNTGQKLVTAALCAVLSTSALSSSAFAKNTFDDKVFDLQSLGILQGDENGELQLDKPVTRAEFSALIVRMMSMQNIAESYNYSSEFTDVPDGYWAKNYIGFLSDVNVISGTSMTTFSPDDYIDLNAASKILVCALGYDSVAKSYGGYPTGYMREATELKLLNGVDMSINPVTRSEIAKMIYNALDIDIMKMINSGASIKYEISAGDTFRKRFKSDDGTMTKLTGTVTATADAYLNNPVVGLDDTRIQINDMLYEISDPSYAKYIGQKVDFFVDSEDSNVITSLKPSSTTSVQTISAKDLIDVSSTRIKYEAQNGSEKTAKYNKDGFFVFNNRVSYDWDENTLLKMKNGTITLIDNDDDSTADVILAKQYTSVVADSVSTDNNMILLKENQFIAGKKYIKIDENSDQRVTLSNSDGTPLSVSDIKPEDVLSCFVSPDENMIDIIVSSNIVSGTVTEITSEYITVDGEEYEFEDESNPVNVSVGKEYDIYLNFNKEAAYAKKATLTDNYAYVSKVYLDEDGTYSAKLVLPNTIQEKKEEEKDEDGGAAKIISRLALQNKQIITLPLADKISVDGTSLTEQAAVDAIEQRIFLYQKNSKGELLRFTSPERIGMGTQKYYNSSERTFGKTSGGAFGVDMDTLTICIPKDNPNPSNDDFLTGVEMNNGQLYDIKAYDRDEESHMAKLIVVTMNMKAGTTGLVTTSSKVGMVQNCSYVLDENDNESRYMAEILTEDGNTASYMITKDAEEAAGFTAPHTGQLISYSLDIEYNIDALKVLGDLSSDLAQGRTTESLDYETFFGSISDIEYNKVDEDLNRWVHTITCQATSGDRNTIIEYQLLKNSGPPIFIYNRHTGISSFATINDIDLANDMIFISAANNSVRAAVVYR